MINRVGRGGASSWTLWQEQLPSTDVQSSRSPRQEQERPNPPSSLPTCLPSAEGGGTQAQGRQGWGNWAQKFRQARVFIHHPRPTASPHMTKLHDWTKALPASLSPLWQWVRPSQLLTHRHLHQEEGCPVWWGQAFRWEQSYWSCSINWTSLNKKDVNC